MSALGRTASCQSCGAAFDTPSITGRLPKRCSSCSPSYQSGYRDEILRLRRQVIELEARLEERPGRVVDADRLALALAIRNVADARGRADTCRALQHLRDVAHSWAHALGDAGDFTSELTA